MSKFEKQFQEKRMTIEEVAEQVQSGWSCATDNSISIPHAIFDALAERARRGEVEGIKLHSFLEVEPLPSYDETLNGKIDAISWFSTGVGRKAINTGNADVMPSYYRDAPLIYRDYIDIDALFLVVSKMDKHGYFSTCNGACCYELIKKAKRIYLEVNENMPRVATTSNIHISQVTALCENHKPMVEFASTKSDETAIKIGEFISEQIPDGATLQFGIGAVPNAVGMMLKSKRDLGIHTEMFTESMLDLLECGAANNSKKPIHEGRTVVTFVLGPQRMYDYVDDNHSVEVLPVNYVNDPAVIAKHPNMISINAAVEVDFWGQVCAESVGTRHLSGTGGQSDFVRGAVQSPGGKSFIAFSSTAGNGEISRIRPVLQAGAVVTTSKNDVDHVVTEYGIAKLRGKSIYQRTKALIAIAHPKFRDELTFEARKLNIMI